MKMGGGQFRSSGRKIVPVERCLPGNETKTKQQMIRKHAEIAILAFPVLLLEAFSPSSGSDNGCHFIKITPPMLTPPPFSKGTHYVPMVVLGRALCTSNSCSRNGRDIEYYVFIKQRDAPHFLILMYKDIILL